MEEFDIECAQSIHGAFLIPCSQGDDTADAEAGNRAFRQKIARQWWERQLEPARWLDGGSRLRSGRRRAQRPVRIRVIRSLTQVGTRDWAAATPLASMP